MPAYLIARIHITDPERYREYAKLTPGPSLRTAADSSCAAAR